MRTEFSFLGIPLKCMCDKVHYESELFYLECQDLKHASHTHINSQAHTFRGPQISTPTFAVGKGVRLLTPEVIIAWALVSKVSAPFIISHSSHIHEGTITPEASRVYRPIISVALVMPRFPNISAATSEAKPKRRDSKSMRHNRSRTAARWKQVHMLARTPHPVLTSEMSFIST